MRTLDLDVPRRGTGEELGLKDGGVGVGEGLQEEGEGAFVVDVDVAGGGETGEGGEEDGCGVHCECLHCCGCDGGAGLSTKC